MMTPTPTRAPDSDPASAVMSNLSGRRVVLGVTGGIAAYKAVDLCRRLVDSGAHVVPVLTDSACLMVGPATFSALASEPAHTSIFNDPTSPIPHTNIAQRADVVVVCPATARVISDIRTGRSGDLLTATILASNAPLIVCPAMHTEMWEQASVQENVAVLAARGVVVVPPESGRLAGGDIGHGRLAQPESIIAAVETAVAADTVGDLAGLKVLVTAGGTREPIDAVRYVGNRSSGKQGHAVASEAIRRGANVVLVTTSPGTAPTGPDVIEVETAAEMAAACALHGPNSDIVVMAAAVADFRPSEAIDHKIKKAEGVPEISMVPTVDILAAMGESKSQGQVLVGFAAETDDLEANAAQKMARKNLDMIVANDVSKPGAGFEHDTNEVVILHDDGSRRHVPICTKQEVARIVLDAAAAIAIRDTHNQEQQ